MAPRAAVCAERIKEVLDTASSVVAPDDPVTELAATELARAPRRRVQLPGRRGSRCSPTSRSGPSRARRLRSSAAPARARPRCSTSSPACSTRPPARCWSTASTCATSSPSCCGAASASCPRSRTCSRARSRATSATPTRTRPTSELWEALEIAQARDFVAAMPGGLDAPIAQGGTNVSGGQRQRLAIARALVRQPEHLPLRRLVLGARPRHRRPPPRRARARGRATRSR